MQKQKEKKQKYEKPQLTKIKLDAKTAVLAACKIMQGPGGPLNVNCRGGGQGGVCQEQGS